MKKRDRKELGRYVRYVADEIGLRDWHIDLRGDAPGDSGDEEMGTLADVRPTPGRRHATIRVCKDFRENLAPETQRMAIVHELVHCHLAALQHQCENDLSEALLGGPASHVFFHGFRRNLEYAVDAIAMALAPHMPLIEWRSERDA